MNCKGSLSIVRARFNHLVLAGMFLFPLVCPCVWGQGGLAPAGAPGPTMKMLSQIEPRTPVDPLHTPGDASDQFSITQPGSYYLTTNVIGSSNQMGIAVSANNVTLDLSGFAVLGRSNSYDGIVVYSAFTNVVIRNGIVSGWGAGFYGIRCLGANAILERLNVSGDSFGILCADGCLVNDCVVNGNQRDGIDVNGSGALIINNNVANNNLLNGPGNASIAVLGINARVEGNHVSGNGSGYGILIASGGSYTNNIVVRNSVAGHGAANYSIPSGNVVGPLINTTGTVTNSNPWANLSL